MLPPEIIDKLQAKFGKQIRYSSDADELSHKISVATGKNISVNTIKRMLGMIGGEFTPRLFTLDIISVYLGFDNWESLAASTGRIESSLFNPKDEVIGSTLEEGDMIVFEYAPNRKVTLSCLGCSKFRVIGSENSKLQVGDAIRANFFVVNYPLIVSEVFRDGTCLGNFVAGKAGGLTSIRVKHAASDGK